MPFISSSMCLYEYSQQKVVPPDPQTQNHCKIKHYGRRVIGIHFHRNDRSKYVDRAQQKEKAEREDCDASEARVRLSGLVFVDRPWIHDGVICIHLRGSVSLLPAGATALGSVNPFHHCITKACV